MNADRIVELVRRVTTFTLKNHEERDPWEKSVALSGILAWNDPEAVESAQGWMDRAVATQNDDGNLNYADTYDAPPGHIKTFTPTAPLTSSLALPLLRYYQRSGNARYLEAAELQMQALMNTPRTTSGGFWSRGEGPELWIDMVYLMTPFMVLYGQIKDDPSYIDEAVRQHRVAVERLVDPFTGLSRHAWCEVPNHYPQSTFWARGNGWLIAVTVDLLEMMGPHAGRDFIAETGLRTIHKMAELQDRSGYFRHVLDGPGSKKEASATLIYAYAVAKAVRLGLLEDSYMESAWRAFEVVAGSVTEAGMVPGVAVPPGGPGVPFGWTPFGQGFFLLAAHELSGRAVEV
ncbi:glycoside hydrolase family 88 protein [Hoeflea alexandrii]|uniref:glycoside hydrolase family 88 protein n=1 Tax=Hoeflea alexandrii TaxID=288436 RepID=UPI0022B04BF7|nr:glycoside hydrolase family 88 protein [Hoeflea alexandrii]MCZ4291667.1 glycoside hydrolase family 88 protein [Hoeflea alexandrii]